MVSDSSRHKWLKWFLPAFALVLLGGWIILIRNGTEGDQPPAEPVPEASEVAASATDSTLAETLPKQQPRTPHGQESVTPRPSASQTTVTPLAAEALSLAFEITSLDDDLAPYYERFPAARTMELVRFEPIGQKRPRLEQTNDIYALKLPLPGREPLLAEVLRHESRSPSRGTIIASAPNHEYNEIIISYFEDAMTASIIIPEYGHFEIAYAGNGNHLLIEIDPDQIEACGGALVPEIAWTTNQKEDSP